MKKRVHAILLFHRRKSVPPPSVPGGRKDCAALRVLPVLDRVEKDPDEKWFEKIAKLSSGLVLFQAPQEAGKAPPWQEYWKESARKKRVTS